MKLGIAVKSCLRDRDAGFHHAIRRTWGHHALWLRMYPQFFMGGGARKFDVMGVEPPDEVYLDAPDDYMGLPEKTHQICKHLARTDTFDYVFMCDNDTYIDPYKLAEADYEGYDYSGFFCRGEMEVYSRFDYSDHMGAYPNCHAWASGGVGYFLSRRAIQLIAATPPKVWAEDMYVGQVLGPKLDTREFLANYIPPGVSSWHIKKTRTRREILPQHIDLIHAFGDINKFYQENP
jgi:Galactosyltransferase